MPPTSTTENPIETTGEEAVEGTVGSETQERGSGGRFGGLTPAEAGRRRWEKQRAREAEAVGLDEDDARTVTTPIRVGQVIGALERQAVAGNANAARELRSWLSEYPPEDASVTPEALASDLRKRVLARLLAEISEEEAAKQGKAEGIGR